MKTTLRITLTMLFFCLIVCLSIAPAAFAETVAIDATNFPDDIFRNYISENFDKKEDGALSSEEIAAVTSIDCTSMSVSSAKGIEFFTELRGVYFMHNQLTALNTSSMPHLRELSCGDNQIKSLDLSNNTELTSLYCWGNQLTKLDVSRNPKLVHIHCGIYDNTNGSSGQLRGNMLTQLDLSNQPNLQYLSCHGNQLTSLDLSSNTKLRSFGCDYNQLTSLDLSANTQLESFICDWNPLNQIVLGNNENLYNFGVRGDQLTSIDISGLPNLQVLGCGDNRLTSIDLSHNPKLYRVHLYNNQLTELDVSRNPALLFLQCQHNGISELNVSNCPALVDLIENGRREVGIMLDKPYMCFTNDLEIDGEPNVYYRLETDLVLAQTGLTPSPWEIDETELILPTNLTTIEEEAFAAGAFTYVKLSENTTKIGPRAFADCPNLRYIYIPEATTSIDRYAFDNVYNLTIAGKDGSYAEFYAQKYGFKFEAVS